MDLMDKDIAVKEEQIDDSEEPNAKRIRLESNGDSHGTEIPNGEANGEGGLTNAEDREQSPAQSTTEPLDEEEEVLFTFCESQPRSRSNLGSRLTVSALLFGIVRSLSRKKNLP